MLGLTHRNASNENFRLYTIIIVYSVKPKGPEFGSVLCVSNDSHCQVVSLCTGLRTYGNHCRNVLETRINTYRILYLTKTFLVLTNHSLSLFLQPDIIL